MNRGDYAEPECLVGAVTSEILGLILWLVERNQALRLAVDISVAPRNACQRTRQYRSNQRHDDLAVNGYGGDADPAPPMHRHARNSFVIRYPAKGVTDILYQEEDKADRTIVAAPVTLPLCTLRPTHT